MGKENVIKLLVSASLLGFESYKVASRLDPDMMEKITVEICDPL